MRLTRLLGVLAGAALLPSLWAIVGRAQEKDSTARAVDDTDRVVFRDSVNRQARPELDRGRSAPDLPMERIILLLSLRPGARQELDRLLADQQDQASPDYHRWLTPDEFGARFGHSPREIELVTDWLVDHGFRVDEVARGRGWIDFSGTARQVEDAFLTEIHDYEVQGKVRHANATEPSIPRGLAGVVQGIVSLHSFPRLPGSGPYRPFGAQDAAPDFTQGGEHSLAPADFATIYNLGPAYKAGINGAGTRIAIVGHTNIHPSNVDSFREYFGLPRKSPVIDVEGDDPGIVPSEAMRAELEVEWAGAVAPEATVTFVVSRSTLATDGVDLSAQHIVDGNLADVMSTSYATCEVRMGPAGRDFFNNLWAQAAAQGITSVVASGNSGPSACDPPDRATAQGLGVSGLCSTPYNVCVGGTQFDDTSNPDKYWSPSNDPTTKASALSYIPEKGWNESGGAPAGLWSSGGGMSAFTDKPAWQSVTGVPSNNKRFVPDVSLTAAAHDGYLFNRGSKLATAAGTSAASPAFAGILALVVQKTGRLGNVSPTLYQFARGQYAPNGPVIFHDVTVGNNNVPGLTGFNCTTGYDPVTGLGSVDAKALIDAFAVLPKVAASDVTVDEGNTGTTTSAVFTVTLSSASTQAASVHYATSDGTAKAGLDYEPTSGDLTFSAGQTTATVSVDVIGDDLFEADETFFLNFSSPAGAQIGDAQAQATIHDDDIGKQPGLSIDDLAIPEGNAGTKAATFTVTLSAISGADTTVDFATQDGTATTADHDYAPRMGTLTIPAGQTSGSIQVMVNGDAVIEPDETFLVNLSNPGNAAIQRSPGLATILNDDEPGEFAFSAAYYKVSEAARLARITVRRVNGNAEGTTVDYATFDGTAIETGTPDYTPTSGTLTFGANKPTATFTIPITNDSLVEGSETVLLRLQNPQPAAAGARLGAQTTAVLTILDGDRGGTISFAKATASVNAAAGQATVTLPVRRGGGLASPVAVDYATNDGTAVAGDYTPARGTLTFAASGTGATMQPITVSVSANAGGAKTFDVELSNPRGGAGIGPRSKVTVTILGADPTLGFSKKEYEVKTTQRSVFIPVKRTAPLTGTVTVDYDATGGTAVQGTDYELEPEPRPPLTFGRGITVRPFKVTILPNPLVSGDKTVVLTLSNPTWTDGTAVVDPILGSATLTIKDPNQTPSVQFSADHYTVNEATPMAVIPVKRTGDPVGRVTVHYEATGGTATNGDPASNPAADYTLPSGGTLTFEERQPIGQIMIPIVNDTRDEGTETVELKLSNPTWTEGEAKIGDPGTATLYITDNEPTVQFSAATYNVGEAARKITIPVKRTGSLAASATVECKVTGGTAVPDTGSGGDYVPLSPEPLSFGAGRSVPATSVTIQLEPDTRADGPKTIELTLSDPSGVALGTPSTALVKIRDNDLAGKVHFSAADYSVAETAGEATIPVIRVGGASSDATVHYSVKSGACANPAGPGDFDAANGTLTFDDKNPRAITVKVHDDGVPNGGAVCVDLKLCDPPDSADPPEEPECSSPSTATLWIVRE
jgi:hypothetical protein